MQNLHLTESTSLVLAVLDAISKPYASAWASLNDVTHFFVILIKERPTHCLRTFVDWDLCTIGLVSMSLSTITLPYGQGRPIHHMRTLSIPICN